jgi:hypothetical protein
MKTPDISSRPGSKFDTLNPYYLSIRYFLQRLFWDIRPIAWKNRQKLKQLKNSHRGEKAVVLCNGPSLLDVDFDHLKGIYTFGLNKINLLFEQTDFRPSSIVAVNPFVLEQNSDFYAGTNIPLFLEQNALNVPVPLNDNTIILNNCDIPFFSRDCSMSIFQGYTVTYVAMQLAFHMGFEKIALVGCDHSFSGVSEPNRVFKSGTEDLSHFSKDYFSKGQLWQHPDLKQSEVYYALAKQVYEASGRIIFNASTRTQLEIFPRIDLDIFIKN